MRLSAYPDPGTGGEPWTIGYGHTGGVKPGDKITVTQAKAFLKDDLRIAASRIAQRIGDVVSELTEHQYAALLSFVFNLGANPSWGIWKRLKARQFDQVPLELAKFTKAGGVRLQGLVNRRADEVKLWSTDDPAVSTETVPSSVTREMETPPTSTATKPLVQSKTLWTGAGIAATGVIQGAQQVQALAAPQAEHNEWIGRIVAITAALIVAGGIAIMVFRWMDQRSLHA